MLLLIFGPPAVGKMTVGRAVCAVSDFRLFHNHMTIEPLIETFGYGTPAFNVLNEEFRYRVLEEAARHHVNLVLTLVWGLELESDLEIVQRYVDIFDGDVAFVELRADLDTRLSRNRTAHRLEEKKSKRDVDWSDQNVRGLERHVMTTERPAPVAEPLLAQHRHLVLDNTHLTADQAAQRIVAWLADPGVGTLPAWSPAT
ncbi:ATP-binding protein [Aestuariimicrobium ganziense]|uniref:AAA family ATPase n=1 Tax=Aestuariimicrobium ganziense TaxID=2773677 RepID=UPI0019418F47|nr:AAA family ATPase [Aestuariimicrobium ganziense]